MTTTPQTLTLAGEDHVVIPRDEYERLRAAADEDAADVAALQRVLNDPDEICAPPEFVRHIVEGEHPVRAKPSRSSPPPSRPSPSDGSCAAASGRRRAATNRP